MASFVCPRCGAPSPVRVSPAGACAACLSDDAWAHWAEQGMLVIDRAAIAGAEARQRRAAARRTMGHAASVVAAVAALGLVALSIHLVVAALASRPVGPPADLAASIESSARRLLAGGAACFFLGLGSLRLPPLPRIRLALRAASLAGVVVGAGAGFLGGLSTALFEPLEGFEHRSMPARAPATEGSLCHDGVPCRGSSLSPAAERVTEATVVIVAPDEKGDARGGAVGTGAVVAVEEGRVLVVTCSHVAMPYAAVGAFRDPATAQPVWIQLADGRAAGGRVVWTARPPLDVALVEAPLDAAPEPVSISPDTDAIDADEAVFFVPNPYRHGFRVDRGKVLRREAHDTPAGRFSLLFTDLPVQHGDSGSGLFDVHGRLIGLNTWSKFGSSSPQGISLPAEALAEISSARAAAFPRSRSKTQANP